MEYLFTCLREGSVSRRLQHLVASAAPTAGRILLGLSVFHIVAPTRAWAYLDPITGSIILQVLAAGFLAAAATFRRSREWMSEFFRKLTAGRKQ